MATIGEVAQDAGVSVATVSRFLRGQSVRSNDAIRQAIQKLGYQPSPEARGLRSGVHYAIAVVVPDITNPFFADIVKGVESVFRKTPYRVFLHNTDEDGDLEEAVLQEIVKGVDGIILTPATEPAKVPTYLKHIDVPVVLVDREIPGRDFDCVVTDNIKGAEMAVNYLVSLGHRKIATIRGTQATTPGHQRYQGFRDALRLADIPVPEEYVQDGNFRESGGYQAMLRLLSLADAPTAVFSANNLMTIGAFKALHDMRVRVPERLSLISFDDLEVGELLSPALTCITRDDIKQGTLAAHMLVAQLEKREFGMARRVMLDVQLMTRNSCSKPLPDPEFQ